MFLFVQSFIQLGLSGVCIKSIVFLVFLQFVILKSSKTVEKHRNQRKSTKPTEKHRENIGSGRLPEGKIRMQTRENKENTVI